jgi:hypothetical protein
MLRRRLVLAVAMFTVLAAVHACKRESPPASAVKTTTVTTTAGGQPADLSNARVDQKVVPTEPQQFLDIAMLGTKLDRNGDVMDNGRQFKKGERVGLTMRLRTSPAGLQTRAVFTNEKGKEVFSQLRNMEGEKVATFIVENPLPPGKYRVVGYWGGNIAVDREFEVTK